MPIERVVIDNIKSFRHLDLSLNAHMNLVVGDNEVGKSTLLEAIHAVMTGQLPAPSLMRIGRVEDLASVRDHLEYQGFSGAF